LVCFDRSSWSPIQKVEQQYDDCNEKGNTLEALPWGKVVHKTDSNKEDGKTLEGRVFPLAQYRAPYTVLIN
jgi:hypothetical protein